MTTYRCRGDQVSVDFTVQGNVLYAKPVHIAESLRGECTIGHCGKFMLKSMTVPEMRNNKLFLNGTDRVEDGMTVLYRYGSSEGAKLARKAFQTTIRKINGSA